MVSYTSIRLRGLVLNHRNSFTFLKTYINWEILIYKANVLQRMEKMEERRLSCTFKAMNL